MHIKRGRDSNNSKRETYDKYTDNATGDVPPLNATYTT